MTTVTDQAGVSTWKRFEQPQNLSTAFVWLSAFYFVYCARPEDWIPGLHYIPLAKVTGFCATVALLMSAGNTKRKLQNLPIEFYYLLALDGLLYVSAVLSPVWKMGALSHTIDFSKLYIACILTYLLVTEFKQFKRVMFIQSACVPIICLVSILKGHDRPRLAGILGGIYSNPNDLAFAIVLSLPFCVAFMLLAKGVLRKLTWFAGMLIMMAALFLTASRAGFIDLVISGTVCLWHFGIRGRRFYLIAGTVLVGTLLLATVGSRLIDRFEALSGGSKTEVDAYGSYEERRFLMVRALDAIEHYPLFGLGAHDFVPYSGVWKPVHMTYLQIAAEAGIPALILFLLFFKRAFTNLHQLMRMRNLDPEIVLIVGALHSSMVGFVVGALFAPEAYQFFPYFAVFYTSTLVAIVNEKQAVTVPLQAAPLPSWRAGEVYASRGSSNTLAPVN
jgi:O-antigen ligase